MIRWKELDAPVAEPDQRRWRRNLCAALPSQPDGTCLGYANNVDDEPCDICKVCDRLGIEVDDG